MGRRKLMRVVDLDKGRTRLAAVKSIDPALDLGSNITVANYETQVDLLTANLNAYNAALSTVDDLYNVCIAQLNTIKEWNERILVGVAAKFGKNSSEYEMAGGVRKNERKNAVKK